ncbi:hypothetical protein [Peribacillus frigoritolerans]|uniref:hypothetical protein n=1 Tax=Peribacillus frigoritolerans TaxID=450367 RepID=UPI003017EA8A
MSNSEKAKQLYLACDNCDPEVSTLMPFFLFEGKRGGIYPQMLLGMMINKYATEKFEDDWIPFNKESFYIGKQDKEGWVNYKKYAYRLKKKGYVEMKFENNQNWIRLTTDEPYNPELYKRKELVL